MLRREIRMRRYRQWLLLSTELQDPGDPLSKYTNEEFEDIYRYHRIKLQMILPLLHAGYQLTDC